jgi:hypothetical protein
MGTDRIALSGYGADATANTVTDSAGTMLRLTDGTCIMLAGVTSLTAASFV